MRKFRYIGISALEEIGHDPDPLSPVTLVSPGPFFSWHQHSYIRPEKNLVEEAKTKAPKIR